MARLALRQEASTIELLSCNVEIKGFEPSTYGLQSRRSSHLSYIPAQRVSVPYPGFHLITFTFKKKGQEGKAACTQEERLRPDYSKPGTLEPLTRFVSSLRSKLHCESVRIRTLSQ